MQVSVMWKPQNQYLLGNAEVEAQTVEYTI